MTYEMLKPQGGAPPFQELKHGANYMIEGASDTVKNYKTASAIIILPNKSPDNPSGIRLVGEGKGRNAFISLGIGTSEGAIDIGIRNRGLDGGGDKGFGWHPYCIETAQNVGYYYDGRANPNQAVCPAWYAPTGAKRAKIDVTPNLTSKNKIRLSVQWLDDKNNIINSSKNFNQEITLSRNYTWGNFYRFVSLVPYPATSDISDSTYMWGGGFESVKLGSSNWGISTNLVTRAWIIYPPKCSLPNGYWATGEEFRIDHWK